MAPLGALTQAWISAEAALPLGWQISGLWRFDELWVALSEGPAFDDYASGTGQYADQAPRRLSDRLRERRGPTTGSVSRDCARRSGPYYGIHVASERTTHAARRGSDLIKRYLRANAAEDFSALEAMRHPDWRELWPQSGEIITNSASYRASRLAQPAGAPRLTPGRSGGSATRGGVRG